MFLAILLPIWTMLILDQGKEFINGVFERLLKLTGTDQRMTSAYNPR